MIEVGYPGVVPVTGLERYMLCDSIYEIRWYRGEFALYRCKGRFLYQENHAIVAWFRESFSGVFRNKNS